jgi:lipoprotein-anchoring transpeptidase ErfK/SrfK
MASVQFHGVLLIVALAAQSSCGGPGRDMLRPVAASTAESAPSEPARPTRPLEPEPVALEVAPEPPPLPGDAWAEHEAGEQAMRAGWDQRYPLHGIAFHMMAQVHAEPTETGPVMGYLRRGTRFRAAPGKAGRGCTGGLWHELASGGFVCTGRGFLVGNGPQTFAPVPAPAAVHDPLPYAYAKNTARSVLQYFRIPSASEERQALAMLAAAASSPAQMLAAAPPSSAASSGAAAPSVALPDYARMAMEPGFYISVDRTELADDSGATLAAETTCAADGDRLPCARGARAFARTVRGAYVPAASLNEVRIAEAPGIVLDDALELPLGIVYRGSAARFVRDPSGAFQPGDKLARYKHVALTGARVRHAGQDYFQTRSGGLVSEAQLRVAQRATRPAVVPRRARWIHVRLSEQTLVAYEGERPVFATLVATGKAGWETPTGAFRIYAKHVSTTMDGLAGSDEVYSIEDVPWTMYFQGSYALHAAFWHDRFGAVRSHGCVNLAPADAQWLFRWTTPVLPSGFHGVNATRNDNLGTYVVIE